MTIRKRIVDMDNAEFMDDLMNFPKSGPLMQAFVIEGLRVYADQQLRAKKWKEETLISQEAWRACAMEVIGKLIAREIS